MTILFLRPFFRLLCGNARFMATAITTNKGRKRSSHDANQLILVVDSRTNVKSVTKKQTKTPLSHQSSEFVFADEVCHVERRDTPHTCGSLAQSDEPALSTGLERVAEVEGSIQSLRHLAAIRIHDRLSTREPFHPPMTRLFDFHQVLITVTRSSRAHDALASFG